MSNISCWFKGCALIRNTHTDPGVAESLFGSDPSGGVRVQELADQVLGFGSDRVPFRGRELHGDTHTRGDEGRRRRNYNTANIILNGGYI